MDLRDYFNIKCIKKLTIPFTLRCTPMKARKIFRKKFRKKNFKGLSLRWNDVFVRNMVLVLWAVFIWRGARNLIDHYFFQSNRLASNIISICIWVFLVFLLDEEIGDIADEEEEGEKKKK